MFVSVDEFLMSTKTINKEIEHLREQLRFHAYQYYVLDEPHIPDAEYDR